MLIGRNDPCPCGSGKKYKKCCMNKDNDLSNKIFKIDDEEIDAEMITNFFNNFQHLLLKDKPHIKEYKKIRKLHGEIIDSMMQYNDSGKFHPEITPQSSMQKLSENKNIKFTVSNFDTSTELGMQALANVLIYKNSKNMNCITEVFLNKNRFRNPEKIEFLKCMLNSEAGLYEVVETDRELGQVHLKNVLTNKEYCVTDIGLSSNISNELIYFYMRLITYRNVCFNTGLNIIFKKDDPFIGKWIEDNLKEYDTKEEFGRFIELYNEYSNNDKGIRAKVNNF